jgi:hypothetical protein
MAGNYRHGMYGTPTYKSWAEMKSRCDHPERSSGHYEDITYCDRWSTFENFYEDMGDRPDGTSLDRIDTFGNYEPTNCRWADIFTQENNRKNNVFYDINGERLTLTQIARKYGISRSNLANKIYIKKWDMDYAVSYLLERKEC